MSTSEDAGIATDTVGEMLDGGIIDVLNPWAIPDWMFVALLVVLLLVFVLGGLGLHRMLDDWRAERLDNPIEPTWHLDGGHAGHQPGSRNDMDPVEQSAICQDPNINQETP